ncbi:hypothetical protein [Taklimakanibacter albus]|uniref:Uncharacterized protein n=1 Tax=Taklimakanibacter albus TaxID=2800327 RepID=A0ACC5R6U6_9HYPH|nr:hypothetical protein [Aestuariivirga sp. YIM B02566]MBK1868293.1 hypothetical protein [Aestuariivirga sp. YIM B02566]
MPTYTQEHEVYHGLTRRDRPVRVFVTCPMQVIEHLDTEILANIAIDMADKGFTIIFKVEEIEAAKNTRPTGRKKKRPR